MSNTQCKVRQEGFFKSLLQVEGGKDFGALLPLYLYVPQKFVG